MLSNHKTMSKKQIGIFVGSLRRESFSKKVANSLIPMAPEGFEFTIIPIGQLELYNQDYDDYNEVPNSYLEFRETVKNLDGVIFITPEYNRGLPAVLKNAIDVASRPSGKGVWDKKPGGVISNSPGMIGAFGAHHQLRQSLTSVNVYTMQQPEIYLSQISKALDESGKIDDRTTAYLQKFINAYEEWFKNF